MDVFNGNFLFLTELIWQYVPMAIPDKVNISLRLIVYNTDDV